MITEIRNLLKKTPGNRRYRAKQTTHRRCNLCNQRFIAQSKFARFCDECRSGSEVYHFSEWLPHIKHQVA